MSCRQHDDKSLVLGLILTGLSFAPAPASTTRKSLRTQIRWPRPASRPPSSNITRPGPITSKPGSTPIRSTSGRSSSWIAAATWPTKPADRLAALDDHLSRMKKLEALIKKVRRLGFGRSYDVGASEYYRLEAEYWLSQRKPLPSRAIFAASAHNHQDSLALDLRETPF